MASARPLRDVFADLAGGGNTADDPDALLRDQGHALPDHLVAEAVVSYADTAPAEVAEHLAPYVMTHSAVGTDPVAGDEPPAGWLDLLGSAPAGDLDDLDDLAPVSERFDDAAGLGPDPSGLDFGTGAGPAPAAETAAAPEDSGDGVDGPAHDEVVEIGPDPAELDDAGEVAGWVAADRIAEPSTEDEAEPDDEPLG
jgi:hypothetical protein